MRGESWLQREEQAQPAVCGLQQGGRVEPGGYGARPREESVVGHVLCKGGGRMAGQGGGLRRGCCAVMESVRPKAHHSSFDDDQLI